MSSFVQFATRPEICTLTDQSAVKKFSHLLWCWEFVSMCPLSLRPLLLVWCVRFPCVPVSLCPLFRALGRNSGFLAHFLNPKTLTWNAQNPCLTGNTSKTVSSPPQPPSRDTPITLSRRSFYDLIAYIKPPGLQHHRGHIARPLRLPVPWLKIHIFCK